ncbi:family 2 encapsulin nanocompartment cargo protein polyprenyl transferase [Streptomyces albiaxialis]|uniref:Family 2 encapsulin nanocompartment cargo protein polyprenyl transferase n=1 Tax=Streptomyces albiaxialis TaxID=329523 RepID=A0ABN2W716_9ACTN
MSPAGTAEEAVGPEEAWELLERARMLTEPALRKAVARLPEPVRPLAAYHFGWRDADGDPAEGGWGKGVRGALALASARAVGGTAEQAVAAAAGVELVHNFSLLHDDLMDRDATRRGRPAVWARFGEGPAVLTGDALLVLAMEALADEPGAVAELCEALLVLVGGQGADLEFETRGDVRLDECLRMAAGKTAPLLSAACALGALAAGAAPERTAALRRFGHHLGVAFQLTDDLLGIWGRSARSGKPVGADLRHRKKSPPVVAALASGTPAGRELAELYLRGTGPLDDAGVRTAAELVERAGGRAWAEKEAARQRAEALAALDAGAPAPEGARALASLAGLITAGRER